ncbi:hypothetical protein KCP75_19410 [Salmonella enterica subsp. enterica]|nr:hypothetical protein KCP75_19410 [Salmonella enterica subsp. enterica]
MEGVGYALADGMDVVHACGVQTRQRDAYRRRGARQYWHPLSDISGLQRLSYWRRCGDPALGAARLAQIAVINRLRSPMYCRGCRWSRRTLSDIAASCGYQQRRETFRRLYQQLLPLMS